MLKYLEERQSFQDTVDTPHFLSRSCMSRLHIARTRYRWVQYSPENQKIERQEQRLSAVTQAPTAHTYASTALTRYRSRNPQLWRKRAISGQHLFADAVEKIDAGNWRSSICRAREARCSVVDVFVLSGLAGNTRVAVGSSVALLLFERGGGCGAQFGLNGLIGDTNYVWVGT